MWTLPNVHVGSLVEVLCEYLVQHFIGLVHYPFLCSREETFEVYQHDHLLVRQFIVLEVVQHFLDFVGRLYATALQGLSAWALLEFLQYLLLQAVQMVAACQSNGLHQQGLRILTQQQKKKSFDYQVELLRVSLACSAQHRHHLLHPSQVILIVYHKKYWSS